MSEHPRSDSASAGTTATAGTTASAATTATGASATGASATGASAEAVVAALEVLGSIATPEAPLGSTTTYRVGGRAAIGVRVSTPDQLDAVAIASRVSGLPVLVVGRGSNLLVADRGFAGIAVSLEPDAFSGVEMAGTSVTVGGALPLPTLARRTAEAGLTGLEWAVGVPGSVGGGVRMNAGVTGRRWPRPCAWPG